jgi:hypothetical protein
MTRTLVIGIPLPHVSFDNYSFASAPSISEYTRLIIEASSVSSVVDEIIKGEVTHATYARQPVSNGATTARSFGLADLLAMRKREAAQFFTRGGNALCIAYPDAAHEGIQGMDSWRRYDWLPAPAGFSYQAGLLPGFGKAPVDLSDPDHPFAGYVALYGRRMAYRAEVGASSGSPVRVFARSSGGAAVAFDVSVNAGRIIFVPPLQDPERDRAAVADTLFQCFERLEGPAPSPARSSKEAS